MKKKLVVEDLRSVNFSESAFKVKKLVNSVEFEVGQFLSKDKVHAKCLDRNWHVEIVGRK